MTARRGGRGTGPTPNKAHTKKKRREQIIDAALDVYRIESLRDSVLEQLGRFEEMAKGNDGGLLKPHHTESIREQHYPKWKDNDFKILVREFRKALEKYDDQQDDTK